MSYQILVLDLDGTLTNSKKEITKPTLDALLDIQKKGKQCGQTWRNRNDVLTKQ